MPNNTYLWMPLECSHRIAVGLCCGDIYLIWMDEKNKNFSAERIYGAELNIINFHSRMNKMQKFVWFRTLSSSSVLVVKILKKLDRSVFSWNLSGDIPYCCNGKSTSDACLGYRSISKHIKIKIALKQIHVMLKEETGSSLYGLHSHNI